MDRIGSAGLFNQAGIHFITEAMIAADFCTRRDAVAVRLITETERPDVALQFESGGLENYEIAEADRLGRRRGLEYRALEGAGFPTYSFPVEEWATADQAYESLHWIADKKSKRASELLEGGTPYPPDTQLLIYLNLQDFGANSREIEGIMPLAVEPARKWFRSVWVLWKLRAYQV